uniref:DNA-directed RNA polymerase subunit beta n=1 Tax=Lygus hesperus TaxID=30085 RepID=A0A0A9X263_LYGHE
MSQVDALITTMAHRVPGSIHHRLHCSTCSIVLYYLPHSDMGVESSAHWSIVGNQFPQTCATLAVLTVWCLQLCIAYAHSTEFTALVHTVEVAPSHAVPLEECVIDVPALQSTALELLLDTALLLGDITLRLCLLWWRLPNSSNDRCTILYNTIHTLYALLQLRITQLFDIPSLPCSDTCGTEPLGGITTDFPCQLDHPWNLANPRWRLPGSVKGQTSYNVDATKSTQRTLVGADSRLLRYLLGEGVHYTACLAYTHVLESELVECVPPAYVQCLHELLHRSECHVLGLNTSQLAWLAYLHRLTCILQSSRGGQCLQNVFTEATASATMRVASHHLTQYTVLASHAPTTLTGYPTQTRFQPTETVLCCLENNLERQLTILQLSGTVLPPWASLHP